ncbi:MAG: hypothetical protein ACQPRI_06095, partial [Solitalea-like symbiont of Tyrophagus putrescentiae]
MGCVRRWRTKIGNLSIIFKPTYFSVNVVGAANVRSSRRGGGRDGQSGSQGNDDEALHFVLVWY